LRLISSTEFKNMWMYTFTPPTPSWRFFLMEKRKHCRITLMTKRGVH
jgi:hypothetical protein